MGFQNAAAELFRKAFEGRREEAKGTWFVQDREALLPTLAAHVDHLHWMNTPEGDPRPEGDGEPTWTKEVVTDAEWTRSGRRSASATDAFAWMRKNEDWSPEDAGIQFLAPLPHGAYHLRAMRVILKLLSL